MVKSFRKGDGGGEADEAEEGEGELVIARGNTSKTFELLEKVLDEVTFAIACLGVRDRSESIGTWRDTWLYRTSFQPLSEGDP